MTNAQAYTTLQKDFVKKNDIAVGSIVKVLRTAQSMELGWDCSWLKEMDAYVGKEMEVVAVGGADGLSLREKGGSRYIDFWFPFFILEFVENPKKEIVDNLTGSYKGVVTETGIQVGCQKVSFEKFDELVKAVEKVRGEAKPKANVRETTFGETEIGEFLAWPMENPREGKLNSVWLKTGKHEIKHIMSSGIVIDGKPMNYNIMDVKVRVVEDPR